MKFFVHELMCCIVISSLLGPAVVLGKGLRDPKRGVLPESRPNKSSCYQEKRETVAKQKTGILYASDIDELMAGDGLKNLEIEVDTKAKKIKLGFPHFDSACFKSVTPLSYFKNGKIYVGLKVELKDGDSTSAPDSDSVSKEEDGGEDTKKDERTFHQLLEECAQSSRPEFTNLELIHDYKSESFNFEKDLKIGFISPDITDESNPVRDQDYPGFVEGDELECTVADNGALYSSDGIALPGKYTSFVKRVISDCFPDNGAVKKIGELYQTYSEALELQLQPADIQLTYGYEGTIPDLFNDMQNIYVKTLEAEKDEIKEEMEDIYSELKEVAKDLKDAEKSDVDSIVDRFNTQLDKFSALRKVAFSELNLILDHLKNSGAAIDRQAGKLRDKLEERVNELRTLIGEFDDFAKGVTYKNFIKVMRHFNKDRFMKNFEKERLYSSLQANFRGKEKGKKGHKSEKKLEEAIKKKIASFEKNELNTWDDYEDAASGGQTGIARERAKAQSNYNKYQSLNRDYQQKRYAYQVRCQGGDKNACWQGYLSGNEYRSKAKVYQEGFTTSRERYQSYMGVRQNYLDNNREEVDDSSYMGLFDGTAEQWGLDPYSMDPSNNIYNAYNNTMLPQQQRSPATGQQQYQYLSNPLSGFDGGQSSYPPYLMNQGPGYYGQDGIFR